MVVKKPARVHAEAMKLYRVSRPSLWAMSIVAFLGVSHWGASNVAAQASTRLTIELRRPSEQQAIPGWFRILDAKQAPMTLDGLYSRAKGLRAAHPARTWYAVEDRVSVSVPKGEIYLEAFSGLNSGIVRRKLDLRFFERMTVSLPVAPLMPLRSKGWYGGNTHLHLKGMDRTTADRYLQTVPKCDRLDVLFVSHLERAGDDEAYITNHYHRKDIQAFSEKGIQFDNGEEHRHNFGSWGEGYGHVMFLQVPRLVEPVSIGEGIAGKGYDSPALKQGIVEAIGLGATVIWCHNQLGLERVPSWVEGLIHAQNIFDGGAKGSYEDACYKYLNIGMDVPFSTGTDWSIYDFSRVFVQVDGPLTASSWLDGLRAGRSFISNGPLLSFTVNDVGPGGRVELSRPGTAEVTTEAVGRADFGYLELVLNGRVIERSRCLRQADQFRASLRTRTRVEASSWLAVRVSSGGQGEGGNVVVPSTAPRRGSSSNVNEMGEALFAHSSPVYLDMAGMPRFDVDMALELIAEMETARMVVEEKGRFESQKQRDTVFGRYDSAIERLRRQQERAAGAQAH